MFFLVRLCLLLCNPIHCECTYNPNDRDSYASQRYKEQRTLTNMLKGTWSCVWTCHRFSAVPGGIRCKWTAAAIFLGVLVVVKVLLGKLSTHSSKADTRLNDEKVHKDASFRLSVVVARPGRGSSARTNLDHTAYLDHLLGMQRNTTAMVNVFMVDIVSTKPCRLTCPWLI